MCGSHFGHAKRAERELSGFRAGASGTRTSPCREPRCARPREVGSWFCSPGCRADVAAWLVAVAPGACASCLKPIEGRRTGARFCSASCRRFAQHTRRKYGLSIAQYVARVRAPGVVCEISADRPTKKWLCLDHDHATGALRGTLCDPCNRGLGRAQDDPALLRTLASYVESRPSVPSDLQIPDQGVCRVCLSICDQPGRRSRGYCSSSCSQRAAAIRKYGLTPEQYLWLRGQTSGACWTCGRELLEFTDQLGWPVVDHCHDTGAIRGVLCNNCNLALQCFRDDPELLLSAADYLKRYRAA